jgi:hypothetical protein
MARDGYYATAGRGEDRGIECPVCSNVMTKMEAEGVTVDVCAGGCGGIWFDWFELSARGRGRRIGGRGVPGGR